MAGINRFEGKDRRRQRLRNHITRDLHSDKYHQRVIPGRKHKHEEDYPLYVNHRYDDEEQ